MTSWMHEDRLAAVLAVLRDLGARRVLDLGCGDGDLVLRLLREPQIEGVVGLDLSHAALARLRGRLAAAQAGPVVTVIHGSMTAPYPAFAGYDCACLVETIEHLTPAGLPALERAVFGVLRPRAVVLTTPNAEFNDLLNVPRSRFRHRDHRFEWDRAQLKAWAGPVAARGGYRVRFADIAGAHPELGGASQMAVFTLPQG